MSALLPLLLQAMRQPPFYPHPVESPIQLLQTHISCILLTGPYAYKLKKPRNLGFLDFSSLEQRHHYLQEELRLNQRGAPDLYLEVLPITQQGDSFHLGRQGAVVEYALKMRQFPQRCLLSQMLEQGEITESLMQDLGRVVASYHRSSNTDDHIRQFGTVASVRQAFDENYAQTRDYIGGPQTEDQFTATQAYTNHFFSERAEILEQRRQQQRIREGHGDLHLGNICYWQNQILLFDCIEFNESFRCVDVMYDVAYGVMDLEDHDRSDLGNAYLNTYLEESGDWEGLQVLLLYLVRQAYVRAKVTSFQLNDDQIPAAEQEEAHRTAADYYRLAWSYTQPRQGQVFLMAGLSGSGKSSVGRWLARRINAIQIRSDAVRKHLGGRELHEQGGPDLYTPAMSERTYSRLIQLGLLLAKEGYRVILDARFDQRQWREQVITGATQGHLPLRILHCEAPPKVLQERLLARHPGQDITDATLDLLPLQQASWETFSDRELPYVHTVSTDQNWQDQLQSWLQA
ncbi:MAG: AAA family ATPase [Synechococcaceae cyanobacterium SM2_3_1]|nr:AAA family ATPase [Synechococcaceae cyanobacterium SM2_3_1]